MNKNTPRLSALDGTIASAMAEPVHTSETFTVIPATPMRIIAFEMRRVADEKGKKKINANSVTRDANEAKITYASEP